MGDGPRGASGQGRGAGGRKDEGSGAGAYAGFGLQFAVSLLVFFFAGQWLDRRIGTAPLFMIVGLFVGGGAAFYSMYRKLMGNLEREEQAKRDRAEAERKAGER